MLRLFATALLINNVMLRTLLNVCSVCIVVLLLLCGAMTAGRRPLLLVRLNALTRMLPCLVMVLTVITVLVSCACGI